MNFDINSSIFAGFLIINIILGLSSSRGIKTIKEYAIGNKNFSTATIVATIVATWVSGEFFYSNIYETYTLGLHAIWIAIGDILCLLFIGLFFAPRMGEFLGTLSIAEAMGNLYGKRIRFITAIAGILSSVGLIAIQLKIAGVLFEYALGLPSTYGIISATIIVTLYSAFGGIKSVIFTDVMQFITFGIIIPLIAYVLLTSIDNTEVIINTLTSNNLFNYKEVFNFSNDLPFKQLFLFLLFIIAGFNPAIFQRIAMAKNTKQIGRSFFIASMFCLLLIIIINWIAILALSINPSLNANEVINFIIISSHYSALKGIILVGVMAMVMSTIDSFINSTAVLVIHDLCTPLQFKNELLAARITSLMIGIFSLALSLYDSNHLQELLVITYSFYMPIVIVPFVMAIIGFRTSEKSVLIGMVSGFMMVLIWDYVLKIQVANSTIFGMIFNLFSLIGSHYLLNQKGGWVGIKNNATLIKNRNERNLIIKELIKDIKSFSIIDTCTNNCPKNKNLISILGLFVLISTFASTHTIDKEYQHQYGYLIDILYPITLCASTVLLTYPLWITTQKSMNLIGVIWNITIFYVLVCFNLLMVLISQFSEIQLMVFMVNIIIISLLTKWRWALFIIIIGTTITTLFYQQHVSENLQEHLLPLQFKIIYLLLLISTSLVIFLRPKQKYLEDTEDKVSHYGERIIGHEQEIERLSATSQKILNKVSHELRLPVGNVSNFSEMLHETLSKSSNKYIQELSKELHQNSTRLSSMILNMLDLATLEVKKVALKKQTINFSELVENRIAICKKIYLQEKPIVFEYSIEQKVMIAVDANYIRQTIDNLVINAIKFSQKGIIKVSVQKKKGEVIFTIKDQGLGIPKEELLDVFEAFKMGSNTESKAEGRGVGLALCKSVIQAHGGTITAESDGKKGATLKFALFFSK